MGLVISTRFTKPLQSIDQESSYSMQSGWQCDFYFGYGYDVIEEDALNEKSCVQVLGILITKADGEIHELEKDLVSLQSELAWGEDEEWSELCCNALTEKINYLDISIRSLKNTNENDVEVQLLMHRGPAEGVHEIVKALLRNCFQKKDEQPAEIAIKNSGKNVLPIAPKKREMLSDSNLKIPSEKIEEHNSTTTADEKILGSSSMPDKNRTDNDEKPVEIEIENSSKSVLLHEIGHSDMEMLSDSILEIISEKVEEHNSSPTADDNILGSSSKPDKKRTDHGVKAKNPAEIAIKNSSNDVLPHATGHSNKKKMLSECNLKIKSEEVEEHNFIPMVDDIILGSSSKPEKQRTDHGEKVTKPAEIAIKKSINNVLPHAIGQSNKKKTLSDSNLKIKSEGVEEHNSTPTAYAIILGSSSKPDEKRTDHGEMPVEIAMKNSSKNVSPHAIGHSNKKSDYNSGPTADDIILGLSSKPTKKRTDHGEKVKGNNVLPHAIGHSNKKKMLSDSNLKNKSEEVVEHNSTPTVYDIILDSSSKPDEKRTDHGENVKPAEIAVKNSRKNVSPHAIGHSNKKKMLSESNLKIKNGEVEEHNFTPMADDIILGSSFKPDKKSTHHGERVKPAKIVMKNSSKNVSPYAIGHSNKKKMLSDYNSSPTADDIILGSSSKPEEKRTDHGEKVKPATTIRKDSSSDAVKDAAGFSFGKSDLNVCGNEVRQYDSTAADKNKTLNSSSSPEGKENIPKTDEPANAIVKGSSAQASRHATGFNRRENDSDSDSEIGAFRQAGGGNPDLEVKLSDLTVKFAHKGCGKGSKIAPTDKVDASESSAKAECKRKIPPLRVKVKETGLFSLTSLSEMPDQRMQETTELQQLEGRKSQAEDDQKVEVASNGKRPILNLPLKPPKLKKKRKIESDGPWIEGPAFSSVELKSIFSTAKSKTQRKSGVSTDIVILNQSHNEVIEGLVQPGQCEAKKSSVAPDDSNISISVSQKKRKKTSNLPMTLKIEDSVVHKDLSNLPGNAADDGSKENLQNIKSYSSNDSHTEVWAPKLVNLMDLSLNELKRIAKEQNLTKYHKLKKQVLVELLAERLGCC
ncbi:uncharacterized protein LOC115953476 isoform X2 [Quercus lobata]|uniref:uncharacterized protein LOC115953476 isoform X2 n=1 Tax=Quercus lobata TaxID=97700 RepID=UPI001246B15B|nr:uncharacterized protein LOC115953476 isoform X2 [Quercus lobata]